jgi:hypothetical protein
MASPGNDIQVFRSCRFSPAMELRLLQRNMIGARHWISCVIAHHPKAAAGAVLAATYVTRKSEALYGVSGFNSHVHQLHRSPFFRCRMVGGAEQLQAGEVYFPNLPHIYDQIPDCRLRFQKYAVKGLCVFNRDVSLQDKLGRIIRRLQPVFHYSLPLSRAEYTHPDDQKNCVSVEQPVPKHAITARGDGHDHTFYISAKKI